MAVDMENMWKSQKKFNYFWPYRLFFSYIWPKIYPESKQKLTTDEWIRKGYGFWKEEE